MAKRLYVVVSEILLSNGALVPVYHGVSSGAWYLSRERATRYPTRYAAKATADTLQGASVEPYEVSE